jgi:hypothetical protein
VFRVARCHSMHAYNTVGDASIALSRQTDFATGTASASFGTQGIQSRGGLETVAGGGIGCLTTVDLCRIGRNRTLPAEDGTKTF